MKFRNYLLAASVLAVALFMTACGGAPAGSAGLMGMVPDGDYKAVMAFKPNDIANSGFLNNLKTNFPMANMMLAEFNKVEGKTGVQLEDIDTVMMLQGADYSSLSFISGKIDKEAILAKYKEDGKELDAHDYNGSEIWHDHEGYGEVMFFADKFAVQGSEEEVKAVIDLMAGTGDKYIDSEAFKKIAGKFNLNSTFTMYSADKSDINPEMIKAQLAKEETDEAVIEKISAAAEKFEAVYLSINVKDAISGDVFTYFADADAASTLAEYAEGKKSGMFEKAADQAEQMGAMMPGLNMDKDKIIGLQKIIKFSTDGNAMKINLNLAWNDIAFIFAE